MQQPGNTNQLSTGFSGISRLLFHNITGLHCVFNPLQIFSEIGRFAAQFLCKPQHRHCLLFRSFHVQKLPQDSLVDFTAGQLKNIIVDRFSCARHSFGNTKQEACDAATPLQILIGNDAVIEFRLQHQTHRQQRTLQHQFLTGNTVDTHRLGVVSFQYQFGALVFALVCIPPRQYFHKSGFFGKNAAVLAGFQQLFRQSLRRCIIK